MLNGIYKIKRLLFGVKAYEEFKSETLKTVKEISEDIKELADILESSEYEAFDTYMNALVSKGLNDNDPTMMFRGAFSWKKSEKGHDYWIETLESVLDRHSMVDVKEK